MAKVCFSPTQNHEGKLLPPLLDETELGFAILHAPDREIQNRSDLTTGLTRRYEFFYFRFFCRGDLSARLSLLGCAARNITRRRILLDESKGIDELADFRVSESLGQREQLEPVRGPLLFN